MHVITRKRLHEFAAEHADAKAPLDAWFRVVSAKRYCTPHEVRMDFPAVDFLGGYRAVFNIGGNKYRLVVDMRYSSTGVGRAYIRHVLTHTDYTRLSREATL